MSTQRVPGSCGQPGRPTDNVLDGTGGVFRSYSPGTVDGAAGGFDDRLARLLRHDTWREIDRIAGPLLGRTGFGFGVVYGMGAQIAGSVADLAVLAKVFILADLYDAANTKASLWHDLASGPSGFARTLLAHAGSTYFGDALRQANDEREALIEAVRYAFSHPGEILENVKLEYADKLKRFDELRRQQTLPAQFEAGRIFGELLLELLTLLAAGAGLAKLLAKFPKLLKLGSRLKTGSGGLGGKKPAAPEAQPSSAGTATTPSAASGSRGVGAATEKPKPPPPGGSKINVTDKGLKHVQDRHVPPGPPKYAGKSKFYENEDVVALIKSAESKPAVQQQNGNFARVFDVGRNVGIDRNAGGADTSIMTVITKPNGDLVTAYPGRP